MAPPAFEKFLSEYGSTGREKADGYSIGNLQALTPSEKEKAINMLESEVAVFGPALPALAALDQQRASKKIVELLSIRDTLERENTSLRLWRWKLEPDRESAERYFDCLNSVPLTDHVYVSSALSTTREFPSYEFVIEYLSRIALEGDDINVGLAFGQLCDRAKPCTLASSDGASRERGRLKKDLRSSDKNERHKILDQILASIATEK